MNLKKYNIDYILLIPCYLNILIMVCPLVDLYANWYVTMIPVVVMFVYLSQKDRASFKLSLSMLSYGALVVFYQYWFLHRDHDLINFLINGVIVWTPCVLALLCRNVLSLKSQMILLQVSLASMAYTCFTTWIGLEMFPNASRDLAGAANEATRELYMSLNIGGFEFVYAVVLALPIVIWMIFNSKGYLKLLNVLIFLSFLNCIYMSAYTTALIFSIMILIFSIIEYKPQYKNAVYSSLIVFVFFAGTGILSYVVEWVAGMVENDYVADRLLQVSLLLQGTSAEDVDTESSNERIVLMQHAWDGFFASPIFGNNLLGYHKNLMSGHSMVLDLLSSCGVLGLFLFVRLFYNAFKKLYPSGFMNKPSAFKLVWFAFIALSIMNPSSFSVVYLVIFGFTEIINNLETYKKSGKNG